VRGAGGVDEQEGVRPARGLAGRSVWPSACRGCLRVTQSEAAPGLSVAGHDGTAILKRLEQVPDPELDESILDLGFVRSLQLRSEVT
jgi:hypothetical protein